MRSTLMLLAALLLLAAPAVGQSRPLPPAASAGEVMDAAEDLVTTAAIPETRSVAPAQAGRVDAAQSTDAGRFLYNVAVGVAVAVISTLILRAIL